MKKLKKIGEATKIVRKSHGLTIENAVTDKLTKSSIGRLESGADIKLSTLLAWLERFETSFDELLYVANNYELSGYQAILNNVKQTYGDNQQIALKKQLNDAKWYFENESNSKRDKLNYLMLKNIVSINDKGFSLNTREKNQIIRYLMSIPNWSNYELALCGNTINAFDTKQTIKLAKELTTRSIRFQDILNNQKGIIDILINVSISLADKKEFGQAIYFKKEVEKRLSPQDMYRRTILKFSEGIIEFSSGNEAIGKRKMEQALRAFELSDSFGFVEMYQKRYDNIVKKTESL